MIRPTLETDFDALVALATASGLFEPDQTEILAGTLRSPSKNDVWFTEARIRDFYEPDVDKIVYRKSLVQNVG